MERTIKVRTFLGQAIDTFKEYIKTKGNLQIDYSLEEYMQEILDYIDYLEQENQDLKEQLEEWKHHLKCSKEMLDIQGQKGNYDYDEYMLGLYNGMEYIIALFETREPNFISGKDVAFTNNKNQQKEFIKYLEEEIKSSSTLDTINKQTAMYIYSTTLRKYRSIIGDNKE